MDKSCERCDGTGNQLYSDEKGYYVDDCSYCGGTGLDLTDALAEANRDFAEGNTVNLREINLDSE